MSSGATSVLPSETVSIDTVVPYCFLWFELSPAWPMFLLPAAATERVLLHLPLSKRCFAHFEVTVLGTMIPGCPPPV